MCLCVCIHLLDLWAFLKVVYKISSQPWWFIYFFLKFCFLELNIIYSCVIRCIMDQNSSTFLSYCSVYYTEHHPSLSFLFLLSIIKMSTPDYFQFTFSFFLLFQCIFWTKHHLSKIQSKKSLSINVFYPFTFNVMIFFTYICSFISYFPFTAFLVSTSPSCFLLNRFIYFFLLV